MLARRVLVLVVLLTPPLAGAETPVETARARPLARRQRLPRGARALRRRQGQSRGALQDGPGARSEVHRAARGPRARLHRGRALRGGAAGAPAGPERARAHDHRRLDREGSATRHTAPRVHQRPAVAIGRVLGRLRGTAPRWNPTALAVIADRDRDPFRVLIACILSLRTQDTTTGPAAARLSAVADTPESMRTLSPRRIERLIYPVGFYRTKARVILGICRDLLERFGGRVP